MGVETGRHSVFRGVPVARDLFWDPVWLGALTTLRGPAPVPREALGDAPPPVLQTSGPSAKSTRGAVGTLHAEVASGSRTAAATLELATTIELVDRAQRGEAPARELLCRRVLQMLKRFATGRLPAEARGLIETQDIVQEAAIRAMRHLEHFEFRHAGALACYLRTILKNLIRDHVRSARRRPAVNPLVEEPASATPSPMEQAIGVEGVELYERALELLKPRDREAIVLRLEQQATYEELAVELGIPTPNAARVAVKRALLRLAREMTRLTGECPSQTGAGPGAER